MDSQSGSLQEVFDESNDDLNDDLNDDSNDDLNDDLGESSSEEIDSKAAAEILEKLENEIATLREETSQIREEIHALDVKKKELAHQRELLVAQVFELQKSTQKDVDR